ncbi:MAG TPA: endonuclease/exonuclease/phosphatase family protein [Candidatus Saccharibacteria bacterium]|nr:endonuclease/exonuclease/phosphatase family protein [Candidatus Saccharibacteria bacterium]HMT55608.1 endonuclease/exonuclease/phosphatase family protein [Candidatus Saccharibacteria bacterium]
MKITVCSWNILNDGYVPKHASQHERLEIIIKEIRKVAESSENMTLFLCEVINPKHFDIIAEATGMVVAGKPIHYRGGQKEYCGFLITKSLEKKAKQHQIVIYDGNHNSIMLLTIGNITIAGTHLPVKVIREWTARKNHVMSMLKAEPDIFSGDFNATSFFPLRQRILRSSYKEAHVLERPPFPYPTYRGQNIYWWLPTISIDAIFYKPKVKILSTGHSLNPGSDHPLIWAECEL